MKRSPIITGLVSRWVIVAITLWGVTFGSTTASAAPKKNTKEKQTCITTDCHSSMGKEKFVHGPIATADCIVCHIPTGKHSFKPISDVGALCSECHDKLTTKKVVHAPVKNSKCTKCHDPHQSKFKFQLRAAGSDLCFQCHKKDIVSRNFVHGPAAVGSCSTCHDMHQSDFAHLLHSEGNKVCFECHPDKEEAFKGKKFTHAPVQKSCTNCHDAHSGNFKYNFTADGAQDLCLTCHKNKHQEIDHASVKHKALYTDKKCLACHDPHVSNYVKQLTMQPADLCMSCHDRAYSDSNGHNTANMKSYLSDNTIYHGPIKQNDCSSCHNTHGSSNFRILRENLSPVFYANYDADNYKACFVCHEKNLANEEKTTTMTNFRNGDQNLHFVHVNKRVKGRTCRSCHDAHATNNPKHIRDTVPFAKWDLPVGFEKQATGGQCLPGCHQMFGYDRNKRVLNR